MIPGQSLIHLARLGRPWEVGVLAQLREGKQLPVELIGVLRHGNEQEVAGSTLDALL